MSFAARRSEWPQHVLAVLPFLLFFPVAIVYLGVVVFLFSLMLAGDYRARWEEMRAHPLFRPVIALLLLSCLAGVFLERPANSFWSSFAHYQTYLFLLLFISVGKGEWQNRAFKAFIAGAVYAATLFYLNALQLLPQLGLFKSYLVYSGNKSILLGILLAIAAGWLLYEVTITTGWKALLRLLLTFAYIASPILFLTKTRTAIVLFVLLCILASVRYLRGHWRGAAGLIGIAVIIAVAWGMSSGFKGRVITTFKDIVAFSQGHKPSTEGNRLEIYALTAEIIAQKPITGHGIATWEPHYAKLAVERGMDVFATPHNDYLLYAAEMGIIGVAVLLWIWLTQLAVAWRMEGRNGMRLLMLGLAIMVGGMFNAVLRDAVFGMAFMILLAIPLAGARKEKTLAD